MIELKKVPHFTTLQKAADRLLAFRPARRLLDKTIQLAKWQGNLPRSVPMAALDGTGLESRHASSYYVKRRANTGKYWQRTTYQRFPKAGIVCDCSSHLILAVVPGRGPGPDITHFRAALDQALSRVRIGAMAADAGYDAEHTHRFAREQRGVRSLIPATIGRQTTKPASGYWRRQMQRRLHLTRYTQRWQIETVNSMLKRLLGSALRARSYWSQCREILLRTITLNVMILRRAKGFYRAGQNYFLDVPAKAGNLPAAALRSREDNCGGSPPAGLRRSAVREGRGDETGLDPKAPRQKIVLTLFPCA